MPVQRVAGEVTRAQWLEVRVEGPHANGSAQLVITARGEDRVLVRAEFLSDYADNLIAALAAYLAHPATNHAHVWVRAENPLYREEADS